MSIENTISLNIFKDIDLSTKESLLISSKFKELQLKKGEILLQVNDIVLHQYYVLNGCLRTYSIDSNGKEHTLQFAIENWWISDYTAFFSTTKALLNIECIQEATIYKISREDLENLYDEVPQLETFFRKKMEKAFASFQKRILGSLSNSAAERYQNFIHRYPNIEQSVKNYHIASYLGITTESLSRIRKKIAQP